MKAAFACAVSLLALEALAAPAYAQETSQPDESGAVTNDSGPNAGTETGNEIVVTAQFRDQTLQDTPLAISAYTGELLEKRSASDIANAAGTVPNVNLSKGQGGFGQFASGRFRSSGASEASGNIARGSA